MASVQEPGIVRLYIEKPNGTRYKVFEMRTEESGPGGAPDHVVSANTDKWRPQPRVGGTIERGDKLIMSVVLDASDGIDVSDCVFSIPITNLANGIVERVSDAAFTMIDVTPGIAVETVLGTYEFSQGNKQFGGGFIGIFIEDDT